MSKTYQKTTATLFLVGAVQQIRKLRSEVNELRHYLERNVARRTEHLTRRIELLEQCNTTLCKKLSQANKSLAAMPVESPARLYVMNSDNTQRVA